MGIQESIQEWGDWSRKSNGSTDAKELKHLCRSKRYISGMQIQLEGVKAQHRSAQSALGHKIQAARADLKFHIDEFLILYRRLLAPLRCLEADGSTEHMEYKAYLRATDCEQCMSQALFILKVLRALPDPFSQEPDNRQSQVLAVVDLCTRLATCSFTTRQRDLSPVGVKLMVQKLESVAAMEM